VALLASEGDCKAAMFYTPVEVKFATVRTSLCARHDPVSTLLQDRYFIHSHPTGFKHRRGDAS